MSSERITASRSKRVPSLRMQVRCDCILLLTLHRRSAIPYQADNIVAKQIVEIEVADFVGA